MEIFYPVIRTVLLQIKGKKIQFAKGGSIVFKKRLREINNIFFKS